MVLRITANGFKCLYGNVRVFVVGDDVREAVDAVAPEAIEILRLDETGLIREQSETIDADTRVVAPVGMSIGLKGFVVGAKTESYAHSWQVFAATQAMFEPIEVLVLSGMARRRRDDTARFFLDFLSRYTDSLQVEIADREESLSNLRRKNEWLLLNSEKARRMIRGAGYGLQSIAVELPAGSETIGPGGTIDTLQFRQALSCDSAGLWGICLKVVIPAIEEGEIRPTGFVAAQVIRASDGRLLADAEITYGDLRSGWFEIDFRDACGLAFGDAVLQLSWMGGHEGAPLFSLSRLAPDRFGDGAGHTVALRVMKGLNDPIRQAGDLALIDEDGAVSNRVIEHRPIDLEDVKKDARWAFDVADIDALRGLASDDETPGYIQTHSLEGRPSGIVLPGFAKKGALELAVNIETAHEAGPTCLYALFVVEKEEGAEGRNPSARVAGAMQELMAGNFAVNRSGLYCESMIVPPQSPTQLTLSFGEQLTQTGDVFLVVQPVGDDASYGWCRWQDIMVGIDPLGPLVELAPAVEDGSLERVPMLRMRSQKFPELSGQIQFLSGQAAHENLHKTLGFSPLQISEESGSLQTHPLKDNLSAAVFEAGLPSGALRVACEVETAHDHAPSFVYILLVVDPSVKDRERIVKDTVAAIQPSDNKTWRGSNDTNTLHWHARVLKAREPSLLELELTSPITVASDIVFAVRPVRQLTSYGWCRWYSLNVTTAPGSGGQLVGGAHV